MTACTFFGHRECPDTIRPALRKAIEMLITDRGVEMFYVGNQGQFDFYVRGILRQLTTEYPHIRYAIVLAYMPVQRSEFDDCFYTMFPEGLETVHPRYAIDRRNQWMLGRADHIICYIHHPWGGAAQYVQAAVRQGKTVINLCNDQSEKMGRDCI